MGALDSHTPQQPQGSTQREPGPARHALALGTVSLRYSARPILQMEKPGPREGREAPQSQRGRKPGNLGSIPGSALSRSWGLHLPTNSSGREAHTGPGPVQGTHVPQRQRANLAPSICSRSEQCLPPCNFNRLKRSHREGSPFLLQDTPRATHRPATPGSLHSVNTALPAVDVSAGTPQSAAPLAPRRAQAVGASLSGSGPHAPQASWYSLKAESGTQSLGRPQNHPAQSQGWDKIPNPQRNRIIKDPASRKPSWLCPGPMGCWDCGV